MIPDWQLPPGVDRGLWDYLHAADMVAGYDEQMRASPSRRRTWRSASARSRTPGRLLDLGCGTGRLCLALRGEGLRVRRRRSLGRDAGEGARTICEPANATPGTAILRESEPRRAHRTARSGLRLRRVPVQHARDGPRCREPAKVVANAFRLLKPGGRFVLHAHNRFFRGLGGSGSPVQRLKTLLGSPTAGDITMPQAYGGAPLTLHHFMRREAVMTALGGGIRDAGGAAARRRTEVARRGSRVTGG